MTYNKNAKKGKVMSEGFLSLDCIPRKRPHEEVTQDAQEPADNHLWEECKEEGISRL